jgi:hypothetical protein
MATTGTGASTPTDDTWQQRLAFVSGNVLVAGLAVTRLWPLAANYQTGWHTHLWTLFWRVGQMGSGFVIYRYLVILIGLAATVVALAVVHILGRGLLLATDSVPTGAVPRLESLCNWTYKSIFLLLIMLVVLAGFALTTLVMQAAVQFLRNHSISSRWAEIIVQTPFALLFVLIGLAAGSVFGRWILSGRLGTVWGGIIAIWIALFAMCATAEGCRTLDLSVNKVVFAQTQNDVIQADLMLGGATSTVNEAELNLCKADDSKIEALALQDLGDGHYVTYLRSSTLPVGNYRVSLKYPHTSLTSSFPFLKSTTAKSVGFLVIQ